MRGDSGAGSEVGGGAACRKGLRRSRLRRNVLFVSTLATLLLVFLGAVPWAEWLAARPLGFTLFWGLCFVLAAFVLALAIYDLSRVRREHGHRVRQLERELADLATEAREAARRLREDETGGEEGADRGSSP